jgi:hypothetical protein
MKSGDYVLGLEPSNSYIRGRMVERMNRGIKTLGAFKTVRTKVNLQFE